MARNLNSHPLQLISDTQMCAERLWGADLIIRRKSQDQKYSYSLEIPAAQVWELRSSDCFTDLTLSEKTGGSDLSDSDRTWIKSHLDRARLFINALSQRWSTLRRIGEYLLDCQAEFLDKGPRYLKPLTRSELSCALGLHESTVSRAVSGKTVQLPDGRIISLSDMFDSSIPAKEVIRQFLAQVGSPLSDRQIVVHLQSQGINLARRTVTKYRQQLNLLPSYYREHVSIGNTIKR
jgi:RNA polymerase sigma-54 factor